MGTESGLQAPVVLVAGAISGIGREAARNLAAEGFSVLVHGRGASRGAAAVREMSEAGGLARFIAPDGARTTS